MGTLASLITDPFIPFIGGRGSLSDVFSGEFPVPEGNPVEFITAMNLVLAVAEAAVRPKTESQCLLTRSALIKKCRSYLRKHAKEFSSDRFISFPDKRMYELPSIPVETLSSLYPSDNSSVFYDLPECSSNPWMNILSYQGFALQGKGAGTGGLNSVWFSRIRPAHKMNASGTRPSILRRGPFLNLLHVYILGNDMIDTLLLNLRPAPDARMGIPYWERMPADENDADYSGTLIGSLAPLSKFMLPSDDLRTVRFTDGLNYVFSRPVYPFGIYAADRTTGKPYPVRVHTGISDRVWKDFPSFFSMASSGFSEFPVSRKRLSREKIYRVWAGGMRAEFNAGRDNMGGKSDMASSCVTIYGGNLSAREGDDAVISSMAQILGRGRTALSAACDALETSGSSMAGMLRGRISGYWSFAESEFIRLSSEENPDLGALESRVRKHLISDMMSVPLQGSHAGDWAYALEKIKHTSLSGKSLQMQR